jgi:hypothetical protein
MWTPHDNTSEITNDLVARLEWHNHGPFGHTRWHRPWSVVVSLEFPTEKESGPFREVPEVGIRPRIRDTTLWTSRLEWRSLSTPTENPTVPPIENPTDRRGDEPQFVAAS